MTNKIHNLDENTNDYFKFILGGVTFNFRYPTTEEVEQARTLDTDSTKDLLKWVSRFITRADNKKYDFAKMYKGMNIKTARAFNKMVKAEVNGKD